MIGRQRQNVGDPGLPDQDIALQRHRVRRSSRKRLIGLYVCAAVMTLIVQIYLRSNACAVPYQLCEGGRVVRDLARVVGRLPEGYSLTAGSPRGELKLIKLSA